MDEDRGLTFIQIIMGIGLFLLGLGWNCPFLPHFVFPKNSNLLPSFPRWFPFFLPVLAPSPTTLIFLLIGKETAAYLLSQMDNVNHCTSDAGVGCLCVRNKDMSLNALLQTTLYIIAKEQSSKQSPCGIWKFPHRGCTFSYWLEPWCPTPSYACTSQVYEEVHGMDIRIQLWSRKSDLWNYLAKQR